MKKIISILVSATLCACCLLITAPAAAASDSINVTLPNFKVTMNGEVVNNDYSKYPLIVYKDITYFPMTYSDCRFLGIESTWTGNSTGLLIDSTGVTAAYNPYLSKERNRRNYTASIPSFPVSVNGKAIDNGREEYPIISFRDITYFPMTWKYCVDQFAWDYTFDAGSGLSIKSANAKLDQISIPKNRLLEGFGYYYEKKSTAVMAKNGYCYYVDDKGAVMQAPLSDMSKAKKVFQLEIWSYGDGKTFDMHSFYEENGKAYLFFHSGGATMGSDHRYVLHEDGTAQRIQGSYYDTALIGDKLYMWWNGHAPNPGNLSVQEANDIDAGETFKALGPADYWYYSLTDINGLPIFTLIGDELYVRAAKVLKDYDDSGGERVLDDIGIYTVNTTTGALTKVSQAKGNVLNAQMVGEYIYFVSSAMDGSQSDYRVYKSSLKDASETFLGDYTGNEIWRPQFAVVGEQVYYVNDETLYRLAGNENLNPKAKVVSISITGDNGEFLACTFKETQDSKYRVMVFDKSGNAVFKTSDSGSNAVVESNTLYFYNITTETLCKTVLGGS